MFEFLKKLFSDKSKPTTPVNVETAPLSEEQLRSVTRVTINYEPPQLLVGCAQSVGKQREHNEDALFAMTSVLSDNDVKTSFGIFLVADGMGGHQHGEVASEKAIRAVAEKLINQLFFVVLGTKENQGQSIHEIMEAAVMEAQMIVSRQAPGGGTTLTAALVVGEQVTIAQVGDSRAYFIYPDGRIQVVTQDHSLVHRLVELGQITAEEAGAHPQRNVLYRAIGQTEPFKPDINTHMLPHPGYMLLCSDGLWGVVSETEMFRLIRSAANPTDACYQLVQAANAAGGPDNISVILVQYMS